MHHDQASQSVETAIELAKLEEQTPPALREAARKVANQFKDDESRIRAAHAIGSVASADLKPADARVLLQGIFARDNAGFFGRYIKPDAPPPTPEEIAQAEAVSAYERHMAGQTSGLGLFPSGAARTEPMPVQPVRPPDPLTDGFANLSLSDHLPPIAAPRPEPVQQLAPAGFGEARSNIGLYPRN